MMNSEAFPTIAELIPDGPGEYDLAGQLQLFANSMEPFQNPNLPYHNWEWHIRTSFLAAIEIYEAYQANKTDDQPDADMLVIGLAILSHDAGYSHYRTLEELKDQTGFDSKEEYSAHIAGSELLVQGYDEELIDKVKAAIVSTRRGAVCDSIEARIVRRADLYNISAGYEEFVEATRNFRLEVEQWDRQGMPLSLPDFIRASWPVLKDYTFDDTELWPGERHHHLLLSRFVVGFCLNMSRLMTENGMNLAQEVHDFIRRKTPEDEPVKS